jgi:histidine triad (HIT) family protein
MCSHAPSGYECPFCLLIAGVADGRVASRASDIVYRRDGVTAFISSHQWPRNAGHVLVIPDAHYENLFDLPDELGGRIHAAARRVAVAMKHAYGCAGISTRQHNEPAGNQDVWHYHLHVFPRYVGDGLYGGSSVLMAAEERAGYARKLRDYFMEERKPC